MPTSSVPGPGGPPGDPRGPGARLGLGLAALARPAYITSGRARDLGDQRDVDGLRRRSHAVLDAGYRLGVRYFDVARSYGRAEEFLAEWLTTHPEARDVLVGSKWGYRYVGQWRMDAEVHEVKDHSLAAFTEQYEQSRQLLGERLGVYHVHSATLSTGVLADTSVHRALARLRDRGIRVGVSTSGPAQAETVRRALEVTVGGAALFTSIQTTWNVLEPSAGPALARAASTGVRVIVKEAVANGRLAPGGADDTPGARRAAELADRLGVPVDQLAIASALAQPWASRVLSGAVSVAQLDSNTAAARLRLSPDVLAELAELAEVPRDYWATRSRRAWA